MFLELVCFYQWISGILKTRVLWPDWLSCFNSFCIQIHSQDKYKEYIRVVAGFKFCQFLIVIIQILNKIRQS